MTRTHRLVGRGPQLELLTSVLDDLAAGRGAAVFLSGEAGIGKTRLAEEVVARAEERGARSAWATCWADAGAPPLWVWSEIVRRLAVPVDLAASVAELPDDAEAARFAQFQAVADALRAASAEHPVVAVLDDLHWADTASLRVLRHVASSLRDAPCLLVGTFRPDELPPDEVEPLARTGTTLSLGGLGREAVDELLAMAVGRPVDASVTELVGTRTDGNPLFVWEFGRLMGSSGRTDVTGAALPAAVTAVLQRRLAHVSQAATEGLQVAALVGKRFSVELVAAVAGAATDVAAAVDEGVAAGVLARTERPDEVVFAHDLIRDVVVGSVTPRRAAELHASIATGLGRRTVTDPAVHQLVAQHLEEAGPDHVGAAAAEWIRAAEWATQVLAYDEAAAAYAHARRLAPPDGPEQPELALAEADALVRAGELTLGRERFGDAADAAERAGRPDLVASAVLGIGAGVAAWEVPLGDADHTRRIERALAGLGPDDRRLRAMLLARLSVAGAGLDAGERPRQRAEEALTLARELADPVVEALALAALCDALGGPAHAAARADHARTIIDAAQAAGDRGLTLLGRRFAIVALLELGRFDQLDQEIARFEREALVLRQPLLAWYAPLFRGMRALLRGDVAEAERRHALVAEAAVTTASVNAGLLAWTLLAGICHSTGRALPPEVIEGLIDMDPALWPSYAAGLAHTALLAGDRATAEALVRVHAGTGFDLTQDAEYLVTVTMFARVATWLGDRRSVELLHDRLAPYADLWLVDGIAAMCWGPVSLELARTAAALGRADEAGGHLARARAAIAAAGAGGLVAEADALADRIGAPATAPVTGTEASAAPIEADGNVFRAEGQVWTLGFAGTTVRMRAAKGLVDLARLLERPGVEVHVADLAGDGPARSRPDPGGDLGERLDEEARRAYRARIVELDCELEEAEANQDRGRAERARVERDLVLDELSSALGLGGRPRRAGDPNERARKAVSTRIRSTIDRIAEVHEPLGRHLRNSVRTGTWCSYQPETPTTWRT